MIIDWFTIGAQVLNFLILVWLMKRFLYKPVLRAIENRESKIAAQITDAESKMAEAHKESEEYKRKNEEFDQQRAVLLSEATEEVKAERTRLLEEARKSMEILRLKQQESLRNSEHDLHEALSRKAQQEVFAIVRKTLADLAETGLEENMVEVFIVRLREMDEKVKTDLIGAFKASSDPVIIRSAFDLPEEQRLAIQKTLNELFASEINVSFEAEPDLISGIELATHGQKLAWSIEEYLTSLQNGISELLNPPDESMPESEGEDQHP